MNTRYTITPGLRLFKKRQGEEVFRRVPFVCILTLHCAFADILLSVVLATCGIITAMYANVSLV